MILKVNLHTDTPWHTSAIYPMKHAFHGRERRWNQIRKQMTQVGGFKGTPPKLQQHAFLESLKTKDDMTEAACKWDYV